MPISVVYQEFLEEFLNVCMLWEFGPLRIRVKSSAYKNPLTGFVTVFRISFMVIRNRDTLRTELCGTPFLKVFEAEGVCICFRSVVIHISYNFIVYNNIFRFAYLRLIE